MILFQQVKLILVRCMRIHCVCGSPIRGCWLLTGLWSRFWFPWMSTVPLYCLCHSASVLLYLRDIYICISYLPPYWAYEVCLTETKIIDIVALTVASIPKASAHSFKQFTLRLLKLSFSLSMHIYNSDGRHAWFHLHGTSRSDRSASEATKYKMKNSLSTVGLEPSTLRFQVWCSTYWASRAWWMLSV